MVEMGKKYRLPSNFDMATAVYPAQNGVTAQNGEVTASGLVSQSTDKAANSLCGRDWWNRRLR